MENTQNSDIGKNIVISASLIVVILFFMGANYYGSLGVFMEVLNSLFNSIANFNGFNFSWITNYKDLFLLIVVLSVIVSIVYLIICLIKVIISVFLITLAIIFHYFDEKEFVKNKKKEIENLFDSEVQYGYQNLKNETENIRDLIEVSISYKDLNCYTNDLKGRLKACLKPLEKFKLKILSENMTREIEWKKRENARLDEERRIKRTYAESNNQVIISQLEADYQNVFKKSRLSENQVKALKKDKFKEQNEYSLIEHKFIRYLIKPRSHHSPTHTFLVWDAMRLLGKIKGVTHIQEHESVDADITFRYNNKKYALEIEIGSLLGKKEQTQNKLAELNKKYPKRWMFIVSNKNLLPKYQELGFTTQRSRVSENLQKLLGNA